MGLAKSKFDQPYNVIGIFKHITTGRIYCILLDKPDRITTNYETTNSPFSGIKIDYYRPPSAILTAFNGAMLFNLGPATCFTRMYAVFELNNTNNYILCDRLDLEQFSLNKENDGTISFELHQLRHLSYRKPNQEGCFFMEKINAINGVLANSHCLPGDVIISSTETSPIIADRSTHIACSTINTHVDYSTINPSDICAGSFTKATFIYKENGPFHMIPDIKEIIFDNPATIVYWKDDSKTIVRVANGEKFDKETGLAMAIAKRYFEQINKEYPRSEFIKAVKNAHVINKAQRKKQRKAEKEAKKNA